MIDYNSKKLLEQPSGCSFFVGSYGFEFDFFKINVESHTMKKSSYHNNLAWLNLPLERGEILNNLYLDIINAQRHNEYIYKGHIDELTLVDAHLLIELEQNPQLVAADLVKILCVDKVFLSRALARLQTAKMLTVVTQISDKRRKNLLVTNFALEKLSSLDEKVNKLTNSFCSGLSLSEQGRLRDLMDKFAVALEVPPSILRAGEHHLRRAIRRFTRALGLLSDKIFSVPDTNALEWHLLLVLSENSDADKKGLTNKQINTSIEVPMSLIAATMQRFAQQGWITQSLDSIDKRMLRSKLTAQGVSTLNSLSQEAFKILDKATSEWSVVELQEFAYLFGAYANAGSLLKNTKILQESLEIRQINSEQELREARIFIVKELPRVGFPEYFNPVIINPKNIIFGLFQNSELVAVLELNYHEKAEKPEIIYAVSRANVDAKLFDQFMNEAQLMIARV